MRQVRRHQLLEPGACRPERRRWAWSAYRPRERCRSEPVASRRGCGYGEDAGAHYGELFATHFAKNDYGTQFIRKAHVLGFSSRQGQRLHMLGGHQLTGVRVSASDLSPAPPVTFREPEPAATPEPPVVPVQRFPVYSSGEWYEVGSLVLHDRSLYRRATRGSNLGDPLQRVQD